jgi:hypothetical protein
LPFSALPHGAEQFIASGKPVIWVCDECLSKRDAREQGFAQSLLHPVRRAGAGGNGGVDGLGR